jgi:hypothetical protein
VDVRVDGQSKVHKLSKVKAGSPLEWSGNIVWSVDSLIRDHLADRQLFIRSYLQKSSIITLQLREAHVLRSEKLLCEIRIGSQEIWELFGRAEGSGTGQLSHSLLCGRILY